MCRTVLFALILGTARIAMAVELGDGNDRPRDPIVPPPGLIKEGKVAGESGLRVRFIDGTEIAAASDILRQSPALTQQLMDRLSASEGILVYKLSLYKDYSEDKLKAQVLKVAPKSTLDIDHELRLIVVMGEDQELCRAAAIFRALAPEPVKPIITKKAEAAPIAPKKKFVAPDLPIQPPNEIPEKKPAKVKVGERDPGQF